MALSGAQKLSVKECLGVSAGPGGGGNANNATIHNHYGVILTLSEMDTLRDELDTYIDNLASDQETAVAALVVEWDKVRLCTVSIEAGGIGDASGITHDPAEKRKRIRELMQTYIPVLSLIESIRCREGNEERRMSISFARY